MSNSKYSTSNERKDVVVEHFNPTLKEEVWTCFSTKKEINTYEYIDVLQRLLDQYNAKYHRSITISPREKSENDLPQPL